MISSFYFSDKLELHAESLHQALTTAYRQLAALTDNAPDEYARAQVCVPAMIVHSVLNDLDSYILGDAKRFLDETAGKEVTSE